MNPSESNYLSLGEDSGVPFQAFGYHSGSSSWNCGSGGPLQHQHLFQVVAHPLQPEVTSISHPTYITTALHPIVALKVPKTRSTARRTRE